MQLGHDMWVGAGVTVGPDGVPRDASGEPIGERGTTISPDGEITSVDGTPVDTDTIGDRGVAGLEEGSDTPDAAASTEGDDEGLDTAEKWGIGIAVAALCAILLACCVIFCMGKRSRSTGTARPKPVTGTAGAAGSSAAAAGTRVARPTASVDAPNAAVPADAALPSTVRHHSSLHSIVPLVNQLSSAPVSTPREVCGSRRPVPDLRTLLRVDMHAIFGTRVMYVGGAGYPSEHQRKCWAQQPRPHIPKPAWRARRSGGVVWVGRRPPRWR